MANRKVDVLIYSGLGSSAESVRHCFYSLRRLLSPNYAVIPVTEKTILNEPWTKSCALLVFPGGADTGYCRSLNGDGNRIIDQYVRRGGAYLGFCAGGYFGSSRCEFEVGNRPLEVVGSRELSFFPGTCRGCAFKGFEYNSEVGAKAVEVIIPGLVLGSTITPYKFKSYYNGGGVFVDAAKYSDKRVEILARYNDPLDVNGGDGNAAVVYCRVNEGKVILTGPHPEFAAVNLDIKSKIPAYLEIINELAENDSARVVFLEVCLKKLGLTVNQEDQPIPSLSRLHLSSIQYELLPKLLSSWQTIITTHDDDGQEFIEAENDIFYLENSDFKCASEYTTEEKLHSKHLENESDRSIDDTYDLVSRDIKNQVNCRSIIKHLVLHKTKCPNVKETPKFNHDIFFTSLKEFQSEKGSKADDFGNYLLYGEVVTSTNRMLERNPKLLTQLPTGFTFTATTQVAGRGRGSNLWVSPAGSLNMSVYIKHPLSLSTTAPVIFIQYVAAIAVVQGIHSYKKGFEKLPIKLKWPNDIYIKDPSKMCPKDKNDNSSNSSHSPNNNSDKNDNDLKSYVKIGGILINSSCIDGNFNLVVGIGLNATNDAPTTSLNALLKHSIYKKSNSQNNSSPYSSQSYFSLERLLARILTCFETLYKKFCLNGFDSSFHALYYSYWLHTNQIVTLETEGCTRARIKGITSDWGLLRVEELSGHEDRPTGKVWNLQSDYNSFDFFKGLLKAKN